jgi:penicillin-insensitive murein endopeptidase
VRLSLLGLVVATSLVTGHARAQTSPAQTSTAQTSTAQTSPAQTSTANADPAPSTPSGTSVGTPQRGHLVDGDELPSRGEGFHYETNRGNPDAHYGTPALVTALVRAAAVVHAAHPGSDLAIHDLSHREGGAITGHGSHRSGRDVDIAYYAVAADGTPLDPTTSIWFAPSGRARGQAAATAPRFDAERTWLFLSALLSDETIEVQYVFMHPAPQRLLLSYGRTRDASVSALERVLRTPRGRRVDPHADHFHVRIVCPASDVARGCER